MLRYTSIVILCCLFQVQAVKDSPRIIIIGTGPAATAAGSRLLENGFDDITILEAENRSGGRVYTKEFAGYKIDVGGQWVVGEKDNVVFQLAWPLGLLEKSSEIKTAEFFSSKGDKMNEDTTNELMKFYGNMTSVDIPEKYENKTFGDFYVNEIDEYFKNHPDIKSDQYEPLKYLLNLMDVSNHASDTWFDVTTDQEYVDCEGDPGVNWKDKAYGTILDILLKKFPNPADELPFRNKTILDAEVSNINYNNSDGSVHVKTKKGDEYVADHVIFTPSLGVLKSDHEKIFDPPLPQKKVNAIEGIEFGSAAKIFVAYSEPWWPMKDHFFSFNFYWTDEDKNEIAKDPNKSWMLGVFGAYSVEHKPNILLFWMGGPHAREMETMSEETVMNGVKEILHRFVGKTYNLTEPTEMLRTQWYTNEHFRGTWSYRSPKTHNSGAIAAHLEEPIMEQEVPRILFAGEATSTEHSSTVHGAIETGWREADRLMKYYGRPISTTEMSQSS